MAAGSLVIVALTMQQVSRHNPSVLMRSEVVVSELIFAVLVTILAGALYQQSTSASTLAFAGQYVLASVLMTGVAFGMWGGIVAGIVIGIARVGSALINNTDITTASQSLSLFSTTVTYCLAGALVGGIVSIMRKAGGELSEVRARDNIARVLHDGVLQTLVIIQRRSKEPEIIDLAATQEHELREFLFTHQSHNTEPVVALHNALASVVHNFSKKSSTPVSIVIAPDITQLSRASIKAIAGACTECLTNISKHANANSITIYAEPDDEMCIVSVRDDGVGFDVEAALARGDRQGIRSSVMSRIEEIGGTVTIRSSEATGTEVEMRVPLSATTPKKAVSS